MVVALVNCKKSADRNCLGSCLKTYADGAHPDEYPGYYFHCGGCDCDHASDDGLKQKIEKLKENGINKIHFTSCINEKCPNLDKLEAVFKNAGFKTEFAYLDMKK